MLSYSLSQQTSIASQEDAAPICLSGGLHGPPSFGCTTCRSGRRGSSPVDELLVFLYLNFLFTSA